uniref:Coiled-coil domain-containing protein 86 n=1 Tax=Oryza punctata TaxID=4537 RepID=A0A0E0K1X1_ORYPU
MASHLDFRYLDEGLGGERGKRKRREAEAAAADSMDLDADADADAPRPSKLRAMPSLSDPSKPASFGQPTYDGVIAGRVSGRRWKEVRTRRASALAASRKPTPLEQRVRDKSLKRAYQARVAELKEEIRQNKAAKRKQREEREKRKKENVLRSGTKLQRVTNPKTIQKIAKSKKRKQLKVVPDEFLGGKKSEANRRIQVPGLEN